MAWLDGQLHPTTVVPFDIADRGFLLGDGVFDTSLVLDGAMVWRSDHLDRLAASAALLGFAIDIGRIGIAIDAVLADVKHGSLRITITRGVGPRAASRHLPIPSRAFLSRCRPCARRPCSHHCVFT